MTKIDSLENLSIVIEVKDPAVIVALLARARGRSWPESCQIAREHTGRKDILTRQAIISALGAIVAKTVKNDLDLINFAAKNHIAD